MKTEKEKAAEGLLYNANHDSELQDEMKRAKCVLFKYNQHLLGDLLLHAGLPGIGIPGFGKAGGYQLFVHRVQWLVHRSCR